MTFSQMIKILKEQNKGKNIGAFFIATEEDVALLNNI